MAAKSIAEYEARIAMLERRVEQLTDRIYQWESGIKKTCPDNDPKTETVINPSTGRILQVCTEHAMLHKMGVMFPVVYLKETE